jgi:hypothetical protein
LAGNGRVKAAKTAEEGSHIQPELGPSGGRGSNAEVKSPKKKVRFGQKPDGHTSELHALPAVQTPVHAETYVLIDSEKDRNGSLEMGSLLQPGIIRAVTLALDEQFVAHTVLFLVFTRYFLARELSFQIMIKDLLKHRETNHEEPPLVLGADVPRLRHIANKRMGYLRPRYHLFKDTVSETEKDKRALVKSHMTMCVRQYHALIPQLDLIATRWGIDVGRMRAKSASC